MLPSNSLRFANYFCRKFLHDAVLMEHDPFRHPAAVFVSEHGHNLSVGFVLVAEHTNRHDLVVFRTERIAIRHKDILPSKSLDNLYEPIGAFRPFDIFSHQHLFRALHERDHFRLGLLAFRFALCNLDLDRIAVQRAVAFPFPDEKYLAIGGFDESKMRLNLGIDTGIIGGFHIFKVGYCRDSIRKKKKNASFWRKIQDTRQKAIHARRPVQKFDKAKNRLYCDTHADSATTADGQAYGTTNRFFSQSVSFPPNPNSIPKSCESQ